jgi:hypothetical protein
MSYSYAALKVRFLLEAYTASNGSVKRGHMPCKITSADALAPNCRSPDLKQAVLDF